MKEPQFSTQDKLKLELCNRSLAASMGFAGLAAILLAFPLVASPHLILPSRIVAALIILVSLTRWKHARSLIQKPQPLFTKGFRFHAFLIVLNAILQCSLFTMVMTDPMASNTSMMMSFLIIMAMVSTSSASIGYVPWLQAVYIIFQMLIPVLAMSISHFEEGMVMKLMPAIAITFAVFVIFNSRLFHQSMCKRFESEDALKVEKENLEQAVRDLQKAQQEILKQKAAAEYAARLATVGQMAGGIAHEINSPLMTISMTAELLAGEQKSGSPSASVMFDGLERIQLTIKRIAEIIRSLLLISREGNKDPFQKFSIRGPIENTLSLCRNKFQKYQIDLKVDPIPDLEVEGREVQISQVLLNLLHNAYDATIGTSQPWVHVAVKDQGSHIEMMVENSGPPIPARIRDDIFQPFFTTKAIGKGTGLGLSISRGFIEEHKGQLKLDASAPNPRFIITLPKSQ